MDNEILVELWETMKPYITARERMHAADELISFMDAHGLVDDLDTDVEHLPKELRAAVITHYDIEPDEEEEEAW